MYRQGQWVEIQVPDWLADDRQLVSRLLAGEIKAVSPKKDTDGVTKAILVSAHAVVRASQFCFRCGKEIENPVSQLVGYGPTCAQKLGIARPEELTPGQLEAVRALVEQQTQTELWIPTRAKGVAITITQEASAEQVAAATPPADVVLSVEDDLLVMKPHRFLDTIPSGWHYRKSEKRYTAEATPGNAYRTVQQLERLAPDFSILTDPAFTALVEQRRDELAALEQVQSLKSAKDLPAIPVTNTTPWHHQKQMFHFLSPLSGGFALAGVGCGKSKVAVDVMQNDPTAKLNFIVTPKYVAEDWLKQFRLHAAVDFRVVNLIGGKETIKQKAARAARELAAAVKDDARIVLLMNYELVWQAPFGPAYKGDVEVDKGLMLSVQWDYGIADEIHKIKSVDGVASRFFARMRSRIRHRYGLTATLAPKTPLDVYGALRFVDVDALRDAGFWSYSDFRYRFAVTDDFGKVTEYRHLDELKALLDKLSYQILSSEVLDLPPFRHVVRQARLSAEETRAYRDMNDLFTAQIRAEEITAANGGVKLLRLQQITSGHSMNDEQEVVHIGTSKQDLLEDVLGEVADREPVVVFCRFHPDLDGVHQVAKKLGRTSSELSGRKNQLSDWRAGKTDLIAVQIQSANAGIDLTRAHYACFFSVGWTSPGDFEQAMGRLHRPGQKNDVTYLHLLMQDESGGETIDHEVYAARERKEDPLAAVVKKRRNSVLVHPAP